MLSFSVTTDIEPTTGTAAVYVQETSREPGVNIRVAFDPDGLDGRYLMTVVDALPGVLMNYISDVVDGQEEPPC